MGLARTLGVSIAGVDGRLVEVECDISAGLPGLLFTGLPDAAVSESRDRLRAAVSNSAADWPARKITVALLPADMRKTGSRLDLAICIAVLAADGQLPPVAVERCVWMAELGLDGRLRPVAGVLPAVLTAQRHGVRRVVVAQENAAEATLVSGVEVRSATSLREVIGWLTSTGDPLPIGIGAPTAEPDDDRGAHLDLADIAGQTPAKRALAVAAAGGHHLSFVGTPGAGKTMLAERLPGLLPPLTDAQALEVTSVHSVAGLLDRSGCLVRRPPLQAPHHTASVAALVGGGAGLARPGAISLAHHGVLFLDEAPEFGTRALDALRQPLEDGAVVLLRSGGSVRYPARFQLVLAANPCPCALPERRCQCPPMARRRYLQRLSGPLLDRIDLRVAVEPVPRADFLDPIEGRQTSAMVAAQVAVARETATARWTGMTWSLNAGAPGVRLRQPPWAPSRRLLEPLHRRLDDGTLTARGVDKVLRLAWTIADLSGHTVPDLDDIHEAVALRVGEVSAWAA